LLNKIDILLEKKDKLKSWKKLDADEEVIPVVTKETTENDEKTGEKTEPS